MQDIRSQLAGAVREAEAGGVVWLGATGRDAHAWVSAHGATDGRLEVHIAAPRRRWGRRRDREGEQALAAAGFVPQVDAWAAPVADHRQAVARLEAGLGAVFRIEAPFPSTLRWAGSPLADRTASVEEHVAAALGTLTRGEKVKACFHVGRPAGAWAFAFAVDGELVMSPEPLAEDGPAPEEWVEPLSPGVEQDAARRLLETHPAPLGEPLFVQLVD